MLIKDVKTYNRYRYISSEKNTNKLDIFLENADNLTDSTLPNISFNIPYIRFVKM